MIALLPWREESKLFMLVWWSEAKRFRCSRETSLCFLLWISWTSADLSILVTNGVPRGHHRQLALSFCFSCHSLGYLDLWFFHRWTKGILLRKFVGQLCDETSGSSIDIIVRSYDIRLVVTDFWLYSTGKIEVRKNQKPSLSLISCYFYKWSLFVDIQIQSL